MNCPYCRKKLWYDANLSYPNPAVRRLVYACAHAGPSSVSRTLRILQIEKELAKKTGGTEAHISGSGVAEKTWGKMKD